MCKRFSSLIIVLFLASCSNKQPIEKEVDFKIPTTVVKITDTTYIATDSLPSGYNTIRFVNSAKGMHSAHIIKIDSGFTTDQMISAYSDSLLVGGSRPSWMTHRGGVISDSGESEITLFLEPGNYSWVCVMGDDSMPHFAGHENQTVVVSGEINPNITLDIPDVKIDMTDDNFIINQQVLSGKHHIEIKNIGSKYHLTAISRLHEGATKQDVINWFKSYNGPPPAASVFASSAIGPGLSAHFTIDFAPGKYILFCMANAEGSFHLFDGAITSFEVE